MQRYREVFPAFHTLYRLTTTLDDLSSFAMGVCRLYRNAFSADKVVIVCKGNASQGFIKICLENKRSQVKKGGISILTRVERELLKQEKELVLPNRLIYPFVFTHVLGGIYIKRGSHANGFSETEKRWFLSLCEEVSLGLKIFELYQEQKKIMLNYIKSLSQFLNQYVPTSYLHTKIIFRLIKAMTKALKLSTVEAQSLEYASLLHDAGKMQVPSQLLKKQQPLTEEEFKLIAKHPRKGVQLFKNLEILKPAIPIILHHHERYDGKGYPSKLKKEQIPLASRILAVLDTFDAMYFGRPYRRKRRLKEIEKEFRAQRGKQFDPRIVDVFLSILKRKNIQKYFKLSSKK
ncbi:MAG: HD domain-containing protein [Candidatus Omnitrophica bacterium]|nr:HD domain-containing protein [Candidatus Omnitrophota bacterium]MBU2044474.1 HD domain-containing protein [Candidatus Omnitrophota bacterium]MBU2474104.1 HD domain-containing protein [Candidatus Omnitrophota bacterium]